MSDRENPPEDLFDAVCRLDDLSEWLREHEYHNEAETIRQASDDLKSYIVIQIKR